MKKIKLLFVALTVVLLCFAMTVLAQAEEYIFTPTADTCIEFSGWAGTSGLKRADGKTNIALGGGTAKIEVPAEIDGWVDLYYYIPYYSAGYTESIDCSANIILRDKDNKDRTYSVFVNSGNGGEWVRIGVANISDTATETISVVGGNGKHSRLTDIKIVTGAKAAYHVLPENFAVLGSWTQGYYETAYEQTVLQSDGKDPAILEATGIEPGNYYVYAHSADFAYSTGNRRFYLNVNGTDYKKENGNSFGTHLKGTELDNSLTTPTGALAYFRWEKMAGTATVGADGKLTLQLIPETNLARLDSLLLTQDPNFIPGNDMSVGLSMAEPLPAVVPYIDDIFFPETYTAEIDGTKTAVLQNEHTTISFKLGEAADGKSIVQREIKVGDTVTVSYEDGLGILSMYATERRAHQNGGYYGRFRVNYPSENGDVIRIDTENVFRAGVPEWLVPTTLEQVDGSTVRMTADGQNASVVLTFTLSAQDKEPKVTIDATTKKAGQFSFGLFNQTVETHKDEVGYVLNPYRWQESRYPNAGQTITETNSTTDHTQMTYKINEKGQEITVGVAVDQSSIDLTVPVEGETIEAGRWPRDQIEYSGVREWNENKNEDGTYTKTVADFSDEQSDFVMNTIGMSDGVLPAVFAPQMGTLDSEMAQGETFTFSYRPLSSVSTAGENRGWYETYAHVATDLRGIYDYRDNYFSSMTDAAFNIINLMKNDFDSGWDDNMIGHYNIEDSHWVSNSNGLIYLQNYMLTEDMDLLMERTLPSMGSILTRNSAHVYSQFTIRDQSEGPINKELIYTSIPMGNATFEGAYLLSRGQMPVYRQIAKNKIMSTTVETATLGIKNTTDIYWYEHANGSDTYEQAIQNADEYLTKRSFLSANNFIDVEKFINISYTPQFQAQLDAYEFTGDPKYLEGAVEGARRFLPSLRITDMPGSKTEMRIVDIEQNVAQDKLSRTHAWSYNDYRYRRGALMEPIASVYQNDYKDFAVVGYDENYRNARDETEPYPAWVTTRAGLGVEQFSTCLQGRNIMQSTWAGDVLRLGYLSNDQLMMDLARSSLVGRFANYPGYYYSMYTSLPGYADYTTNNFDMTSLYFHHIPVFLSAVQDYLFSNAYVKSDGNVDFPNTRIQGYAWFNNRIYGHEAGVMYEETNMWPWLKEGTITLSNKQIDWIAGRKTDRAAFAFTNAGDNNETFTVTFNESLGIANGAVATLYDKEGNKTFATVQNNQITLTVPQKGIVTLAVSGSNIDVPEYAKIKFDEKAQPELGNTAIGLMYKGKTYKQGDAYHLDTGYDVKAYALALEPTSYMGFIAVSGRSPEQYDFINENGNPAVGGGDGEKGIVKTTLTWHFEGETEKTVMEDSLVPFEFRIPVYDRSKNIVFTVKTEYADGTVMELDGEHTISPAAIELEESVADAESFGRPWAGEKLNVPADGSGVALTVTHMGGADIALDRNSALALGFNPDDFKGYDSANPFVLKGTDYEGLTISGTISVQDYTYNPNAVSTDSAGYAKKNIFENNLVTYFEFADMPVQSIRYSTANQIVLCLNYADYRNHAKNIKKFAGCAQNLNNLTATTTLTGVKEVFVPSSDFAAGLFNGNTAGMRITNLVAKAAKVEIAPLPAGTKVFYMQADQMFSDNLKTNADGLPYWKKNTLNGFSVWRRDSDTAGCAKGDTTGPFTIAVPNFSGEYNVYALKYGVGALNKTVKGGVNGTHYVFSEKGGSLLGDYAWNIYVCAPDTQVPVTIKAGEPMHLEEMTFRSTDETNAQGGLLALLFVPVNEATVIDDTNRVVENLKNVNIVAGFSAQDFAVDKPQLYNVTVKEYNENGVAVNEQIIEAEPYWVRSQKSSNQAKDISVTDNMLSEPSKYATVADVLAKYYNSETAWDKANTQIYINGVRQYAPQGVLVDADDIIEIKKDAVTALNFNAICMDDLSGGIIDADNRIRWRLHSSKLQEHGLSYLYDYVNKDEVNVPMRDILVTGYFSCLQPEYLGQRVYFDSKKPDAISFPTTTKNCILLEFLNYQNNNSGDSAYPTITINGQLVHNPYRLRAKDNETTMRERYSMADMYIVPVAANTGVYVQTLGNDTVLRSNTLQQILVMTKSADGMVVTEKVDLLPTKAYRVQGQSGDTVYVWDKVPYNGTVMKPLIHQIVIE